MLSSRRVVSLVLVGILIAISWPSFAGGDDEETTNNRCAAWSLQGVRLGMTLAEVRQVFHKKLRRRSNNRLCARLQKGAPIDLFDLSTDICFHFDRPTKYPKAVVKKIVLKATDRNISLPALKASLIKKWGKPRVEQFAEIPTGMSTTPGQQFLWWDEGCDAFVQLLTWPEFSFAAGQSIKVERHRIALLHYTVARAILDASQKSADEVLFGGGN